MVCSRGAPILAQYRTAFSLSLPQIKGKYELHCYVTEELVVDRSDGTIGIGLIESARKS